MTAKHVHPYLRNHLETGNSDLHRITGQARLSMPLSAESLPLLCDCRRIHLIRTNFSQSVFSTKNRAIRQFEKPSAPTKKEGGFDVETLKGAQSGVANDRSREFQ